MRIRVRRIEEHELRIRSAREVARSAKLQHMFIHAGDFNLRSGHIKSAGMARFGIGLLASSCTSRAPIGDKRLCASSPSRARWWHFLRIKSASSTLAVLRQGSGDSGRGGAASPLIGSSDNLHKDALNITR
jgi:hypothetical protein